MAVQRLQLFQQARGVPVEVNATIGAIIGVNLFRPDGVTLVTEDELFPEIPETPEFPITYWSRIMEIPPNVVALANTATTGLYVITDPVVGVSATREIQPTIGRTTVANGDGLLGDPTIDLAVVVDSGVGAALMKRTIDAWGRVSGSEAADTDDLAEGVSNLYFTVERAQDSVGLAMASTADILAIYDDAPNTFSWELTPAIHDSLDLADDALQPGDNVSELVNDAGYVTSAILATTITDGDTTHAPDGNAVFDALAGKQVASPLLGQKAAFCGDSITWLGNYPALVGDMTGLIAANYGLFGFRWAETPAPGAYDALVMANVADAIATNTFTAQTAAANALFTDSGGTIDLRPIIIAMDAEDWSTVEHLCIMYGTNDYVSNINLGDPESVAKDDFRGAINYAISTIQAARPNIQITLVTLPFSVDCDTDVNTIGARVSDYANATIERGAAFKVPVLDLLRAGGINQENYLTFLPDGTHPNAAGNQRIAEKIAGHMLTRKTDAVGPLASARWAQVQIWSS